MNNELPKLSLVTPARNEAENISLLYESLRNQMKYKYFWLIIENDSTDNTWEIISEFKNTENLKLIKIQKNFGGEYNVGVKYSKILNFGVNYIKSLESNCRFPIGICDADCIPNPNYFKSLLAELENNKKLAIVSGRGFNKEGVQDKENILHVRGNCRLFSSWYISKNESPIEPSPDPIAIMTAKMQGFDCYSINASYVCREMSAAQSSYEFYGYSAAYRGVSVYFAILKTMRLFLQTPWYALTYAKGYFKNKFIVKDKLDNDELREFIYKSSIKDIINLFKKVKK